MHSIVLSSLAIPCFCTQYNVIEASQPNGKRLCRRSREPHRALSQAHTTSPGSCKYGNAFRNLDQEIIALRRPAAFEFSSALPDLVGNLLLKCVGVLHLEARLGQSVQGPVAIHENHGADGLLISLGGS